jgi:WD40 repeat protein
VVNKNFDLKYGAYMTKAFWLAIFLLTTPVLAVSTSTWTQTNQEDFKKGTLDNVVATNLGDVKLSRAVKTLLDQDPRISSVNALAEGLDGTIYAGTGPQGVLLAIKDQKVTTVATIDSATSLTSLLVEKSGRLLIGTAGHHGRVLAIDKPGDKPHSLFDSDDVQYVWQIAETPDGNIYAATGPNGKLYQIKPDGSQKVLLDSGENNLLSLISDGADILYAGTDPHGLVYRVNRKTGESFVLYNAAESEIGALALDKEGNLYAATSEAREQAAPPAANPSATEPKGRPEGGETGAPIPSNNPKPPQPPQLPDPNPGEPHPIPKHSEKTAFMGFNTQHSIYLLADDTTVTPVPDDSQDLRRRPSRPQPPTPNPGKPQPPNPGAAPDAEANPGITPANRQPAVNTANSGEPRPEGNAVYKIDRDGFVTEIFREPVLVLAMVERQGTLLIATGSEGEIYQVNPKAEETIVLAKVDPKQVTCLLPARDGNIYMGMANVGSIATMSSGFATKGTYTSPVLDATQISRFGKINLRGTLPPGTSLSVSTRSGNVKEPEQKGWSNWSADIKAEEFLPIQSPSARFLQYRLTFDSKDGTATPVLDEVTVAYQMPNLPPQVKSIRVTGNPDAAAAQPAATADNDLRRVQPTPHQIITWDAADPNNDALLYTLSFRRLPGGPWIQLKDKLADATFDWDTRTVADGRYEIKVVASDANANPAGQGKTASRVSDAVIVDNTPPVIGDLKWIQKGEAIRLDFKIADETSTVAACDFAIDSNRDWQMVLPVDNIFDSPEETVSFTTPGLQPGQHQITLRATDAKGNQAFQTVFVSIKGPVAAK